MSHIPNPFQRGNMSNFASPSPRQPNSPGFLMMTRPPTASTIGPDGRGRSMGTANFRSLYNKTPYYNHNSSQGNQNRSFNNYRRNYNHGYDSRGGNHSYNAPSNNYNQKPNSFPHSPNLHSTPNNYQRHSNRGGSFSHKKSFNTSQKAFQKTPLKEVPVDKFISINMVKDPWEEFDYDTSKNKETKISNSKSPGDFLVRGTGSIDISESDRSHSVDKASSSSIESSFFLDFSGSSSIQPSCITSSEKESEMESDSQ